MQVTLGTDPELFIEQPNVDILAQRGLPNVPGAVPAWFALGLVDPEQHIIELPHGALGPDGAALEFTTDVTTDPKRMVEFLRANLAATRRFADALGGKLTVNPRVYVDQTYIDLLPQRYGKACSLQLLGCDPDVNAYDMQLPAKPNPKKHNYRTSGGHIHIGIGELTQDRTIVAYTVAALDATLGCASKILCSSEEARLRQEQYGYPGMYRVDHRRGTLEYRTMPAQALIQTPELAEMCFDTAARVGDWVLELVRDNGQSGAVEEIKKHIGDLDVIFQRAEMIRDHNIQGCRELVWAEMVSKMLTYEMPTDFYLHGWE